MSALIARTLLRITAAIFAYMGWMAETDATVILSDPALVSLVALGLSEFWFLFEKIRNRLARA